MASLTDSVMQNSTTQTISMTGTSAATANAFTGAGPFVLVEIECDQPFHFVEGVNPTSTTSHARYRAGVFVKKINSGNKIAVIKAAGSSDATVYVTQQV